MNKSDSSAFSAAILVKSAGFWSYDTMLACDQLEFYYLEVFSALDSSLNPYNFESRDHVDILYVSSHTWRWLIGKDQIDEANAVNTLRKHCHAIVMIDGWDSFDISLAPHTLELFDLTLKVNGVYRDKDLYNWKVGCDYTGANWTDKIRSKDVLYTTEQLEKIHCSFPCFVGILPPVRDKLRIIKSGGHTLKQSIYLLIERLFTIYVRVRLGYNKPSEFVHFVGDLGHYQRYEMLKVLRRENIPGRYGVFRLLHQLCGIDDWRLGKMTDELYDEMSGWLINEDLLVARKNRLLYLNEILNSQVILSPTGFGELCFRHGEAMSLKRTLVCQDLSHVEINFPYRNNENVVFTSPDLSDLTEKLKLLQNDNEFSKSIAQAGYTDWKKWESNYQQILNESLIIPVQVYLK